MARELQSIGVIGGGAFGTALALAAARAGRDVTIWARDEATVEAINTSHSNPKYLPDLVWQEKITATMQLSEAVRGQDALLLVTPAQTTREMIAKIKPDLEAGTPVLLCAKGIEAATGELLSQVVQDEIEGAVVGALSGPSFASDIAKGLPTAITIACEQVEVADALAKALASASFRPYATDDLTGVQIGGALKNVLAIACGAAVGYGLGASAQAALTTRGFAELSRLGSAMGAKRDTLMGLSGLGDLVLTCSSAQSRNFAFGLELGRGRKPKDLIAPGQKLAEGAFSANIAVELAHTHGVEMPIATAVAAVISEDLEIQRALSDLMTRPLKREAQ
ncbi:NAD(P)-dependent glycerol-3-phosphate dehydrogenase [Rhodobacteraceae bacterium RKSG542]|uniref:NAD(P)H-dependent glycerol-3-phosphate dehydrogenase n=1 Tax=Pseudovibrio flavus TaxID=2529854 RepID=UPI0012BB4D02|nr:NAD(P)H-dependent glycerol-3-phosphate dehydrogenase [Pseudovibrio flavus]MTI16818.1 NAD(P)-dependent glycerol-3-phosphate dehydrogenase [Pseudovibrio flavus]